MQRYSPDKQSGLYFSKSKRENAGRKKMKAYERLLKYITVWTTSDENSTTVPTTKRQLDLGNLLVEEMKEMGLSDVSMDEYGYVYGYLPATEGMEDVAPLGLIAHLDTAPDQAVPHLPFPPWPEDIRKHIHIHPSTHPKVP